MRHHSGLVVLSALPDTLRNLQPFCLAVMGSTTGNVLAPQSFIACINLQNSNLDVDSALLWAGLPNVTKGTEVRCVPALICGEPTEVMR